MKNFRINTVAAGCDEDTSAEQEALATQRLGHGRKGHAVTGKRPRPRRNACKGRKRNRRPEAWQWAA